MAAETGAALSLGWAEEDEGETRSTFIKNNAYESIGTFFKYS